MFLISNETVASFKSYGSSDGRHSGHFFLGTFFWVRFLHFYGIIFLGTFYMGTFFWVRFLDGTIGDTLEPSLTRLAEELVF